MLRKFISSADLYELILNSTDDVFYFYTMKGKILFVNDAFEKNTGYSKEQLYRDNLIAFIHSDDIEKISSIWKGLQRGEPFENVEYRMLKYNGEVSWYLSSWRIIRDKDGFNIGILGKQQKKDHRTVKDEDHILYENQIDDNLKSQSSFLANMTHEIRNPLAAIIGFSDLLVLYPKLSSSKQNQYIENIHTCSQHLLKLLDEILEYSRFESGCIKIFKINIRTKLFFSQIYKVYSLQAKKKKLDYKLNFASSVPSNIFIDATRIRQVLFNLIGNAIKFTGKGYVHINVKYNEVESKVIVEVCDSGIGICEENRKTLFQPYEQLNIVKGFGGTGLGLYLSKILIEKHGGELKLAFSKLDHGSVFSCSFDQC